MSSKKSGPDAVPPRKPPRARTGAKKADKRGTPKGKGTVKTKSGGRIGNPRHDPTTENRIKVEAMVAAGAQHWFIAEELGISEDTLTRHYPSELQHGKSRVDWKVGGSIVQKALAGDSDMQKYYAARRAGWKTTTAVEASGPEGGPIVYSNEQPRRDLSAFSDEDLETWEKLTAKLERHERAGDE